MYGAQHYSDMQCTLLAKSVQIVWTKSDLRVIRREMKHASSLEIFFYLLAFICHVGIFKMHGTENFVPRKCSQHVEKKVSEGGGAGVVLLLGAIFADFTVKLMRTEKVALKTFPAHFSMLKCK